MPGLFCEYRRTEEEITYLGIDEKSSERGHTYASILSDIDRSRVLDLVPERKLGAAVGLLQTLTQAQRMSVKAVAMDIWPAYMSATRQCMPQADIVHDKFHISEYLGEASPMLVNDFVLASNEFIAFR